MTAPGLVKRQALLESAQQRPSHVPAVPTVPTSSAVVSQTALRAPVQAPLAAAAAPAVTATEIEKIKEAARVEGLTLGRKQAQQELEKAAHDKLAALESLLKSLNEGWLDERERMHAALADFAFVAVNRLLGDCLRDPQVALSAVRSALAACDAWQELTVEVHPHDAELIGRVLSQDASLADKAPRVLASQAVRLSGCRITSSQGSLDARLEVQLAQLRASLDAQRL